MTSTRMALVEEAPAAAEASFADRFLSFGAFSGSRTAAAPAATPTQPVASEAATPVATQPIAVPVPTARPAQADGAVYSTASAPTPTPAATEDKPLWKRLNPFGG
jgi:hypothetical protein